MKCCDLHSHSVFSDGTGIAGKYPGVPIILWVIGFALAIFLGCIALDKLRLGLFRLARVDSVCQWLECRIKALLNALCARVNL
jgi:hypothetical protein